MKTLEIKIHSKLFIIAGIFSASLILVGLQESFSLEKIEGTHAEINYSIKIGPEKHLINYNVCSDKKTIESPKILILSDYDTTEFTSTKTIWAGSCHTFESQIKAKNPYNVTIIITN